MAKSEQVDLTDAELIDGYVADMTWRELAATTISVRRSYLAKFSREVGIRTATQQSVQEWLGRPTLQSQSRTIWLTIIHGFYQWANHEGHFKRVKNRRGFKVDFDPTAEIVKPRSKKGKPHPISGEDLTLALENAEPLMKCWLLLGALCGCRCQEIAFIEREHVHDDDPEPWLHIERGKGNKDRDVPLHEDVLAALNALPMNDDGALWNMTAAQMSKAINNYLHRLGIKSTAHKLRHFFGTMSYRSGVDLQLTADMMGHSNTAVTSGYAAADHRKAAGIIGRISTTGVLAPPESP